MNQISSPFFLLHRGVAYGRVAVHILYVVSISNGTLHTNIKSLYDVFGPVFRVAPNELSLIAPQAWKDDYIDKPYSIKRSKIFYGALGYNTLFRAGSINYARIRGAVSLALRTSVTRGL